MNKFQIERLRKLAHHLIEHNFEIKRKSSISVLKHGYETHAQDDIPYFLYAIEEIAELFPDEWSKNEDNKPFWIYDEKRKPATSTMHFFGIYTMAFLHLFVPAAQNPIIFGGVTVTEDALPKRLGLNILAYIERLEITRN